MEEFILIETIGEYKNKCLSVSCIHKDHLYINIDDRINIYNLITNKLIYTEEHLKEEECPNLYVITSMCIFNDMVYISSGCDWGMTTIYNSNGYTGININHDSYVNCTTASEDKMYIGLANGQLYRCDFEYNIEKFNICINRHLYGIETIIFHNDIIIISISDAIIVYNHIYGFIKKILDSKRYKKLIIHNNLLYVFQDDEFDFDIINLNDYTSKNIHIGYGHISAFIYNDKLYVIAYFGCYQTLFHIDGEKIYKMQLIESKYSLITIWQNKIYFVCNNGIDIYSEYFPRHFNSLPISQKSKILNFQSISKRANIHKDISLLFIRELLKNKK